MRQNKTMRALVGGAITAVVAVGSAVGQEAAPRASLHVDAEPALWFPREAPRVAEFPAAWPVARSVPVATAGPLTENPPDGWLPQDPADSLYREARGAINRGEFGRAAELFRRIRQRFPRSEYVPDAYYWEAFALYRTGSTDGMRVALAVLDEQAGVHPDAATRSQADVLATRIRGRLAAQGDAAAAERIAETVAPLAPSPPSPPRGVVAPAPPSAPAAPVLADAQGETDLRIAALSALMQMDAERAVPILEQVLARRDAGSVELRRKAVFLVSQKRSPRTEQILLDVARNDPDTEVRAQAVFWLSEVPTEGAVAALDSILQGSSDRQVQEKAIFALSQHRSERASRALRTYVERRDVPEELRSKGIFWLGESHSDENQAFLRGLYDRLQSQELKERVIFSVAQSTNADNHRWLLDLARNASEPIEVRKKALFWAGESGVRIGDLIGLYDSMSDFELKKQLIFVYSERQETEAVDKLMDIARSDPNPELRRKAVFWLGQSNDPRVAQFLLEIISQ